MSNFKEKSQIFIIGLMTGLIIAGGFFILKLDDYFKELNFYKTVVKTFHSDSKNDESSLKPEEEAPVKEKKIKENVYKNTTISTVDSSHLEKVKKELVTDKDTINKHSATDSLASNATVSSEDIVVRKDELLSSKTLEVVNVASTPNHTSAKDSLLQKVSDIKDDKNNVKQLLNIELWQSPLNYRGYKMSKYKIVLYGIASTDGLKIYTIDEAVFLKNSGIVYKLENTSDFKPYERVTDESIISKLK